MKFSMTGQENDEHLIQVTTWEVWLYYPIKPEGNTAKPPIWSPLLSLKVIQPNLLYGHLY
jgi:hypothetical protein